MGNHDVMAQDILSHGANVGNQELPLVCEEGTTLTYAKITAILQKFKKKVDSTTHLSIAW